MLLQSGQTDMIWSELHHTMQNPSGLLFKCLCFAVRFREWIPGFSLFLLKNTKQKKNLIEFKATFHSI